MTGYCGISIFNFLNYLAQGPFPLTFSSYAYTKLYCVLI